MGVPRNTTDAIKGANTTISNLKEFWHKPETMHYRLDGFVLGTAMLLGSIMILRALRNRTGWPVIRAMLIAACYLSTHALSYVLGKLSDNPLEDQLLGLVVVWAVFLIVLDGMTYNSHSESLEDNEATRKRFLWDKMIPSLWFLFILFWNFPANPLWIPLLLLWLLYILKLSERKQALIYACRSRGGLDRVALVVKEYMQYEHLQSINNSDPQKPNPTTMHGYNYMVGVKQALKQVVSISPPRHGKELDLSRIATVQKIWECEGSLLGKDGDPDGKLKDRCLSFSLFWLLLRRFADYDLEELSSKESRDKTWNFVRNGLIKEQEDGKEYERAFRVVEVELQYLSDFFFANYFAVYCKGPRFLLVRVTVFVLYLLVSFVTVGFLSDFKDISKHWYDIHNLQIRVTQAIIWILTLVELAQLANLITSRWNKVKWICSYAQKCWWDAGVVGRCKATLLYILCRAPCFKPWHRKLGQYSLLDSYGHVPKMLMFKCILDGYMEFPMKGQNADPPIKLSNEVKKAVVLSLQTNGRRLSNGVASLKLNQVEDKLSWACTRSKRTSQIILVWHIATNMCKIALNTSSSLKICADLDVNFHVASSLSKYCAYLVAFVPKLLPEHVYIAQWTFEKVVSEAIEKFKDCHSKEDLLKELNNLCLVSADAATTLEQGALLGRNLIHGIENASLRWKVLADFWAEMILFLAPSGDAAAHAEHLATGGEFITHLWALLTHAGIVDRDGCDD